MFLIKIRISHILVSTGSRWVVQFHFMKKGLQIMIENKVKYMVGARVVIGLSKICLRVGIRQGSCVVFGLGLKIRIRFVLELDRGAFITGASIIMFWI